MKIKQAAESVGLTVEAVRYFEREGLALAPLRLDNGYRAYGPGQIARLRVIANCRALEMSHEEILALLAASAVPGQHCDAATRIVQVHGLHIAKRIETLQHLQATLQALQAQCAGGPIDGCALVAALGAPLNLPPPAHASQHL